MGNILAFLDFVSHSMILKKQEADSGCLFSGKNYPAKWDNCSLSGIIDLKDIMELDMQQDAYLPNQY